MTPRKHASNQQSNLLGRHVTQTFAVFPGPYHRKLADGECRWRGGTASPATASFSDHAATGVVECLGDAGSTLLAAAPANVVDAGNAFQFTPTVAGTYYVRVRVRQPGSNLAEAVKQIALDVLPPLSPRR